MLLTQIQDYLQTNHIDGWLLYDFRGQNSIAVEVAGLTSSGSRRWFLWIPREGRPAWLIHAIERATFEQVNPEFEGNRHIYVGWQQLAELLPSFLRIPTGKTPRIAMEYSPLGALPYVSKVDAGTLELIGEVTGADIISSADLVQMVQAVLSPAQMESHRRAAAICLAAKDEAFGLVAERLRTGVAVDEYQVQSFLVERLSGAGLFLDHPPIVAVNGNAAIPHYAPTAERFSPIQPGDMLLIDLWGKEQAPGACFADMTWTAFCGAQLPAKVAEVFSVVKAAQDAAVAAIQDAVGQGRRLHGYEVDDIARGVIQKAGYGEGILHRTGHSLGPAIHWNGVNLDNLETQDRRRLIPGVMVTVEPGIYLPYLNWDGSDQPKGLGIRSEINCIVHADRLEITTDQQQAVILLQGA
jgi:Xaa-Pro aminopeptidase